MKFFSVVQPLPPQSDILSDGLALRVRCVSDVLAFRVRFVSSYS